MEPRARVLPITFGGSGRNAHRRGGLRVGASGEESQQDEFVLARIAPAQRFQRFGEREHFFCRGIVRYDQVFQLQPTVTAAMRP